MKKLLLLIFILGHSALYAQSWDELNNKVSEYYTQGDFESALNYANQELITAKKEFGTKHHNYGISLFNIAFINHLLGNYNEALPNYINSLKILKKTIGEDDVAYISYEAHLADLYNTLNMYDEAIMTYANVVTNSEKYYGAEYPNYVVVIARFANVLYEANMLEDAKSLYKTRIEFIGENLGKNTAEYNLLVNNLGALYLKEGEHQSALSLFEEAVNNTKDHPENDPLYSTYLGNLAETYRTLGSYDLSISIFKEALDYGKEYMGVSHPNYLLFMNNLSATYILKGDYDLALEVLKQAIDTTIAYHGKDNITYNTLISSVGDVYRVTEQYDKAILYLSEAIEYSEKNLGGNSDNYITQLSFLAEIYHNLGQFETSDSLYQKLLYLADIRYGKDNFKYYQLYNNLVALYQSQGNYKEALSIQLDVLENTKRLMGETHPYYGIYLGNVADIYRSIGNYEDAFTYYDLAEKNIEIGFGKESSYYGNIINNKALAYATLGDYNEALKLFLGLKSAYEKGRKIDKAYALLLNNLADVYRNLGQYDKALEYAQSSLRNIEKVVGKNHHDYNLALSNIGLIYQATGQYQKALTFQTEALENIKKTLGESHPTFNTYLSNIAMTYRLLKQYDKSIELLKEAIENIKSTLGENQITYGLILNNLGTIYLLKDEYKDAYHYIQQAVDNFDKNNFTSNPNYAVFLGNIAYIYAHTGQDDKAIPLYLETLKNIKENLGEAHPNYGLQLNNISSFYIRHDELDKAYPYILENIKNIKAQIDQNFSFLSEKEKENFIHSISPLFHIFQNVFSSPKNKEESAPENAFNIELLTKGLILSSSKNLLTMIENSSDTLVKKTYDDWSRKKMLLAKQYTLPLNSRSKSLAEWENEAENLEKQLIQITKSSTMSYQIGKTSWQDIQKKLSPTDVAIEFSSFRYWNGNNWTDTTQYIALILRKDSPRPQLVPLFTQNQFDKLLTSSGSGKNQVDNLYRGAKATATSEVDLTKIYDLIWKPLEVFLKNGETIYFAPSGTLNQIAFSAITTPDGKYLSDKYDLRQISTTAKLLEETSARKIDNITLFGGINYDEDREIIAQSVQNIQGKDAFVSRSLTEDLQRGGETWNYLQGTLTEVERIQTVAQRGQAKVNYHTGNQATEEQFKALNGKDSPQILHIATHGFFFPDPQISEESLDRMQLMGEQQNMFKLSDNPLNRSGLLFAGANHTWKGEKLTANIEDGILTAYEASNIALPNTELVVLSACETGLGDIQGSEGVYGLQRSFKMAGTKYLLMSLWQVPDKETAEFMEYFYIKLFASNNIEASYKATQEYMKQKYVDEPYKWAAFVLVR